jgi:hypothetical protein
MLLHRWEFIKEEIQRQLRKDVGDMAMSQYSFMDDLELATVWHKGKRLTKRQQRLAREWEKSKREAPILLIAAHERVLNVLRAQQEQKSVTVNVERAVIRVPETRNEDIEDAVIIEGDLASR